MVHPAFHLALAQVVRLVIDDLVPLGRLEQQVASRIAFRLAASARVAKTAATASCADLLTLSSQLAALETSGSSPAGRRR